MKKLFILFFLLNMYSSIDTMFIDGIHCKASTCHTFRYGLRSYPRRKEYDRICSETVHELQSIPQKYGTCINNDTGKLHPPCIYALAKTIKNCMNQLYDLSERDVRFYCGHTLMKYCAVHLDLHGLPLEFNA